MTIRKIFLSAVLLSGLLLVSCQTVQQTPLELEPTLEPEGPIAAPVPLASPEEIDLITRFIETLTIEEKVGQMLLPALIDWNGNWVTTFDARIGQMLSDYHVGGVILYRPNVVSRAQLTTLNSDLQQSSAIPLFITIDHEGGWVNRLNGLEKEGIVDVASAALVGSYADARYTYNLARLMGDDLASLGINMNLAPVADVLIDKRSKTSLNRAYGSDPAAVGVMVQSATQGLHELGIIPVLKHFPGHGSTAADSHVVLPRSPRTRLQLQDDIRPFAMGLQAGAGAVMVAHVSFPEAFSSDLPSSLSSEAIRFLRSELSYDGVVMTDSLNMPGVQEQLDARAIYIQAVQSGEDILLRPTAVRDAYETLTAAVKDGTISGERIDASVRRILALKLNRGLMRINDDLSISHSKNAQKLSATEREALIKSLER